MAVGVAAHTCLVTLVVRIATIELSWAHVPLLLETPDCDSIKTLLSTLSECHSAN